MLIVYLQIAYALLGAVVSVVGLILVASAVRLAHQRRKQDLLGWLLPALAGHVLSSAYWIYVFAFRWLGGRATLTSELFSVVIAMMTSLVDLYALVRLVSWVRDYCRDQNKDQGPVQGAPTHGVWPPPPRPPGT